MTDPEDKERTARRESMRASMEEQQKVEALKLRGLGFDWRKSPRIDRGVVSGHPLTEPTTLDITLPTGRQIRLKQLHQSYVYDGMLCGLPGDPERYFLYALERAEQYFPNFGMPAVLLEPLFQTGTKARGMGPDGELYAQWMKLPDVCTLCEFDSNSPARDQGECYSSLLVIWFQDDYGLPDDARMLEQLRSLDWDVNAWDWTP